MKHLYLILFAAALVFSAACTKNNLDVPENFDNKYNVDLRIFNPLNVAPASKDGWWLRSIRAGLFDENWNIVGYAPRLAGSPIPYFDLEQYIRTENGKIVEKVLVKSRWDPAAVQLQEKYWIFHEFSPAEPIFDSTTRELNFVVENEGTPEYFELFYGRPFIAYVISSEPDRFIALDANSGNKLPTRDNNIVYVYDHVDFNPLEGKTKVDTQEELYKKD